MPTIEEHEAQPANAFVMPPRLSLPKPFTTCIQKPELASPQASATRSSRPAPVPAPVPADLPLTGKDVLQRHRRNIHDLQQEVAGLLAWKRRVEQTVTPTKQQVIREAVTELVTAGTRGRRLVLSLTLKMGEKDPVTIDNRPRVSLCPSHTDLSETSGPRA